MRETRVAYYDEPDAVRLDETEATATVQIHHKPCEVGLPLLPTGAVDVIVTSPPYNLGVAYADHADDMDFTDYLRWLGRVFSACQRVLAPEGSLFLNLAGPPSEPTRPWNVLQYLLDECIDAEGDRVDQWVFWRCQNVIHWVKSASCDDGPVTGHQKPVNSPRYLNGGHEYLFHLTKTGRVPLDKLAVGVPYADKSNLTRGRRGKNGDLRDRGNVWMIPYATISSREKDRPHPATFPVELARRAILLHGLDRCRLVLDPFMGSGSTALAALSLGRPCVGFERSAAYARHSHARLVEAQQRASFGGARPAENEAVKPA